MTKKMMKARANWNEKIQDRVAKTSNIITQLKIIKMAGLSKPILGYVERLRATELEVSMRERNLRVIVAALSKMRNTLTSRIFEALKLLLTSS